MTHATPTIHSALEDELDSMWRFAQHLTNCTETAESLVSRTFVTALERRHQYPSRRQWRTWLLGLVYREWSQQPQRERAGLVAVGNAQSQTSTAATCFNGQLCQTINQLPEAHRLVILLVCVEEFSYAEAADILDESVDTVISRLVRARVAIGTQQQARSALSQTGEGVPTAVSMQAASSSL
jgi:RNA polymerase sigma-70 factor (ECF subfamily)